MGAAAFDATGDAPDDGWWASGDFPVRTGCRVRPLIDGRAAMLAMCHAFLAARHSILLAGWDIRAELQLVRGEDARVGADGGLEQRGVQAGLRAEGLDDAAIRFWNAQQLRVVDVLGFAVRRGVRVGVILWDAYHLGSHITNDPVRERAALEAVGVTCLLDDSSRHIRHMTQSLHQKCAVVDGSIAFVGGIDLTAQMQGDYDRWDTHIHPCASTERIAAGTAPAHPWHDVHTRIEGPLVADVQRNIVQRWSEVAARHGAPRWPEQLPATAPAPIEDGGPAQIVRTIPVNTYAFAPAGITTIKDAYVHAFARARRSIYLENQYFWPEVFVGLDSLRWGERSAECMEVLGALAAALERGVRLAMVLPDHPNCGRRFTDGGIAWLLQHAPRAAAAGNIEVFTLGNAEDDVRSPGRTYYRPVYVHAKVAIIDDLWWTAGSANLNSRGMYSDAEINTVALNPVVARALRMGLWAEHLHVLPSESAALREPEAGLAIMRASARANLARVRDGAPLVGHLLPYVAVEEAPALGVSVHPEHGWLDALPGGAGALPPEYANRYL